MRRPILMTGEEKWAALCLLAVAALIVAAVLLLGCRATAPAWPCAGATAAPDTAAPLVTPAGLSKPATAALQRAQTATACVSTEVVAARRTLAADVAPTLPVPAAAIDARLATAERAAANLPPALQGLASAAAVRPAAAPADLGDRRVWRWAAALGALAMLGGAVVLALALVWGLGTPRLGAGIAAAGLALAVTSYVWQTWAHVATLVAGCLAIVALLYAGWLNRAALKAALRMDSAIKAGYPRETAKAVAVAEQSPAVAAAIKRAKDVLPILPPLPPATPTPPHPKE